MIQKTMKMMMMMMMMMMTMMMMSMGTTQIGRDRSHFCDVASSSRNTFDGGFGLLGQHHRRKAAFAKRASSSRHYHHVSDMTNNTFSVLFCNFFLTIIYDTKIHSSSSIYSNS
jgi:hypothetical protein